MSRRLASLESGARDVVPVAGQGGLRRRARPNRARRRGVRPARARARRRSGRHARSRRTPAPHGKETTSRGTVVCRAEAEVDARILRRQVAAPRLHLARRCRRAPRDDRARHEAREPHVQPVADRPGRPQQQQLPADRVHGDRPSGRRCRRRRRRRRARSPRRPWPEGAERRPVRAGPVRREHAHGLGVAAEVRHRDRARGEHELRAAGVREVDPRGAPAGEAGAERPVELGARVREASRARSGRRPTARRASSSRTGVPSRRRDAHARERVGDAVAPRRAPRSGSRARRVGRRAARPRHVHVEVVGVLVVRHVEVGAAVAVDVREERAEAVAGRTTPPGRPARPTSRKRRPPSFRNNRSRTPARFVGKPANDPGRCVRVGVAGGEEIGPSVAVHVADRSAGVPARLGRQVLRSKEPPPVPEHGDAVRRGDDEVGPAVAVQVAGGAAVALQREACVRLLRNVREPCRGRSRKSSLVGSPPCACQRSRRRSRTS